MKQSLYESLNSYLGANYIHTTEEALNDLISLHKEVSFMNFLKKKKNKILSKIKDSLNSLVQADHLICSDDKVNMPNVKERRGLK